MLALPITPETALTEVINPALKLLPERMRSDAARRMLVAIALQESGLTARQQHGGPAHGLWQFERGGGVAGALGWWRRHSERTHVDYVLDEPGIQSLAVAVCARRGVKPTRKCVYQALAHDDILAACFARLLLWTDPDPLPEAGDEAAAWSIYLNTWRPGKPRPAHFIGNWRRAVVAVQNH